MSGLARLAQPLLLALDPDAAHGLAIRTLRAGLVPHQGSDAPSLRTQVLGLDFPNPFGTAAGFDKSGEVADPVLAIGFGFHEVGAVTPRPQPGNPRPRVFRLIRDRALINRLGFNNDGLEAVHRRLAARRRGGVVGANLGANTGSPDMTADYVALVERLAPVVDFFTVNVSSPNTPGLRDLQKPEALEDLLGRVLAARDRAAPRPPVLVKISPDLSAEELPGVLGVIKAAGIDGLVVSNTTVSRAGLKDEALGREAGGLSGVPLFRRSTALLGRIRQEMGAEFPLIGVGGVSSPKAAYDKIRAGASLVQLYTGLVYEGIGLLGEIKTGVAHALAADGLSSVAQAVGLDAERWATEWTG